MSRVLVVDDEPALVRATAMNLTGRGFDVSTASSAEEALRRIVHDAPDLVVLDLGLPDADGTSVIREVRQSRPELPVIVVSARTTTRDKVAALDLGAVDYLPKPFDVHELVARVRATLRRYTAPSAPTVARVGDVTVDLEARAATRSDGTYVRLTPTEWNILAALVTAPGRLVPSRELLLAARGDADHADSSYLRIFVGHLRRKLEPDPAHPVHLLTEAGMGYRFRP